ncbi:MAG: tetratricopeptide repeat protein [Bacteroidales bacterium]
MSFCLCVILFTTATSQDKVTLDSLQSVLNRAETDSGKIKSLIDLSNYFYTFNYAKSLEYVREAKSIAAEADLKKWEAKTDNIAGNIFLSIGDYKEASRYYFNAVRYYESIYDTLNSLRLYTNLGALYDRLEEYDKALSYYFKVLDLYGLLGSIRKKEFPMTSLYNNIANIYQTKGDTASALQYYRKSLTIARETNNKTAMGIVLNNLGKLHYIDLHRPAEGLAYLLEGLQIRESLGDKAEIARSLIILSDFYDREGSPSDAIRYSENAMNLSREIGSVELQSKVYQQLSSLMERQGNMGEALAHFKLFKVFNDSIQKQVASSEIARLQLQYDFENAEKLREARAKQARIKYIIVIITLAVGLVIALLITRLVRIRAKQTELKQKALAQDVEIKNKELTTNVMYLVRKNELINSIAERLLNVRQQLPAENQGVIHDIIFDLQKEGDSDSWKEFELRFNQVHLEFYNRLRQLYPGLTPSDEKLCAFLRLNMSTKEISAITQQSTKTIEVARARLRKKLNLTNTNSNLVTHLMNL